MEKKSRENYSELNFEAQAQLVKNYRENKPKAWENLYKQYEYLIIKIANNFSGYNIPKKDRFQEAKFGFLMAVQTYDETKEVLFSTHANNKIRANLWEYVRNCGEYYKIISNKENRKLFYHLRSAEKQMNIDENTQPTEEQYKLLAEKLSVSVKNVEIMHKYWYSMSSTIKIDDAEEEFIASSVPDPEMLCIIENMNHRLRTLRYNLSEQEKIIVEDVIFNGVPLNKVGQKLGISGERVRQIKNDILQKLKRQIEGI
ncbi:MAG: sigma-70 family RNA polymerase sigma factor [Alphaproteobacteria bacterium]|nr:sigma-70 family RNA polymerase sigma factor [Alphaproteobacteria bacterium]